MLLTILSSPPLYFIFISIFPNLFLCPYKRITGNDCPLCGTTTAIIELIKLNITKSIQINKFGLIAVVIYLLLLIEYSIIFFIRQKIIIYQILFKVFLLIIACLLYFNL